MWLTDGLRWVSPNISKNIIHYKFILLCRACKMICLIFLSDILGWIIIFRTLYFLWEATNIAEGKAFCPSMLSCDHLYRQIRKTSIWHKQGDIHPFSQVYCSPTKESLIYKHLLHTGFLQGTFLHNRIVVKRSEKDHFWFPFEAQVLTLTMGWKDTVSSCGFWKGCLFL